MMKPGVDVWAGTKASAFISYVPGLKELGVQYIRLEFGNWSLPNLRTLVPQIVSSGFEIQGLLIEKTFAPTNPTGWGDWVEAIVTEFKSYVHLWECWNEPNQANTFFNGGTALQYVAFLKECYTHAKLADPSCMVLGGSVAFTHEAAIDYGRVIYENGGYNFMDALAWHPYCNPYAPDDTVNTPNPFIYLDRVKAMAEGYGDYRNIWITELGWQSNAPCSEANQAAYTVQALQKAYAWGWVESYTLYRWKDSSGDSRQMGLLNTSLMPKPVFYAVKDFIWNYIPPPVVRTRTLTVVPTANGTSNPPPGTYTENVGAQVAVQAIPNTGYRVQDWLQDGVSTGVTLLGYTVTMDADHTLQPIYQQIPAPPPDQGTISVHALINKVEIIAPYVIVDKASGVPVSSGNTPALDIIVNVGTYTVIVTLADGQARTEDVTVSKNQAAVVTLDFTPAPPFALDLPMIGGILLGITDVALATAAGARLAGLV